METLKFNYVSKQDNTTNISIADTVKNLNITNHNTTVLYDGTELNEHENYILDTNNKQIKLLNWSLNQGEKITYKITM